jgi:ribosomal protein S18 acetylase RimI-like enzyme
MYRGKLRRFHVWFSLVFFGFLWFSLVFFGFCWFLLVEFGFIFYFLFFIFYFLFMIETHRCNFADSKDFAAVGELINAYIADEMGGGKLLDEAERVLLSTALKEHPKTIVLLATDGDVRCGLLVAFENISTFTVRPMFNVHDVIVLPEYRGKGVGRKLFAELDVIAREHNCSRLTLEVRNDNIAAQNLYRSIGFTPPEPEHFYWRKTL